MDNKDKIKVFATELDYLKSQRIRRFAERVLSEADEYFFIYPASSSGKYHPVFARGIFGLALHTKVVCYFMKSYIDFYGGIEDEETDLAIISAMFHDIKKYGSKEGNAQTISPHGLPSAEFVKGVNDSIETEGDKLTEDEMNIVFNAVAHHMGKFEEQKQTNKIEKFVALADATASFKRIKFAFEKEEILHLYNEILPEHRLQLGKKHVGFQIKDIETTYFKFITENNTTETGVKGNSVLKIISEAVLTMRGLKKS